MKRKLTVLLICLITSFCLHGQTPSTDMFDGWGKRFWNLYFENDNFSPNGSDANFTQGFRIETLWKSDSPNIIYRNFTFSMGINTRRVAIALHLGKSGKSIKLKNSNNIKQYFNTDTLHQHPNTNAASQNDSNHFVFNDLSSHEVKTYYDIDHDTLTINNNNYLIIKSKSSQPVAHNKTSWFDIPPQLSRYITNRTLLVIESKGYNTKTNKTTFMIWFPAAIYENHRMMVELDSAFLIKDLLNRKIELEGVLLRRNMYPFNIGEDLSKENKKDLNKFNHERINNEMGVKVYNGVSIAQFQYTPYELVRNQDISIMRKEMGGKYRPFVGVAYISLSSHSKRLSTDEYLFSETKVGVWGPYAFAKELQGALHSYIGYVDNPGYKWQLKPTFPVYLQTTNTYRKDFFQNAYGTKIGYIVGADIGNVFTQANTGLLFKVGNFENQRELKYGYKLTGFKSWFSRNFKFFGFAKPTIHAVAFNGLISHTFGSNDDRKLISVEDLNLIYAKLEAGVGFKIGEFVTFSYTYIKQSAEYRGQPNAAYGRILLRVDY